MCLAAIERVLQREGGFSDDPHDPGGATTYGITEDTARRYGYTGPMKDLPKHLAIEIYQAEYWNPLHCDEFSPQIAEELFDTGVNMGTTAAARFLQRALNALNDRSIHYPDVAVDGIIGPRTLAAYRTYVDIRGDDDVLYRVLNGLQIARYVEIVENREASEKFFYGWMRTRT